MVENEPYDNIINDFEVSYWELKDNTSYWSSAFINGLGYAKDDVSIRLNFFLEKLIHPRDKDLFRDNFYSLVDNNIDFIQNIQVKKQNGSFKEFTCKTNSESNVDASDGSKVIFFFENKIKTSNEFKVNNFYYRESAEMMSTGSWYIDLIERKSYWDKETRRILEYPEDYIPSLKTASNYFLEEYYESAKDCFLNCARTGIPFNTEFKMITAYKRTFWAKAIGKPVYNNKKEIIGVRGVFQDIDNEKNKTLSLQKTSDIIASQNSRLFNFAHIVSHNLRSHTSNLSLIVQLIEDVKSIDEKLELIDSIKDISDSLNTTIEHLNDVVTIQTKTDQNKVTVSFEKVLNDVLKSIGHIIAEGNVTIRSDFSRVEHIDYIPAYMESILLNLITNAIKYKHEERDAVIEIKTDIYDKKVVLAVKDNGRGIDMEKFGNKLFGMYNTFHYNSDAVGIGLFITKNQIESLNGEIFAESEVGKGTTFKIHF